MRIQLKYVSGRNGYLIFISADQFISLRMQKKMVNDCTSTMRKMQAKCLTRHIFFYRAKTLASHPDKIICHNSLEIIAGNFYIVLL